jgi:hypothetical protein
MNDTNRQFGATGIWWRIGATAGLLSLCVLATVRHASGAFEPESVPVADLTAQNGIVSGTMRLMGGRFLLYNGTRLESMAQTMEVNFARGGSMVLCPRSQLQILTASGNAGIMLAFQSGGAQQPFPLKMGDEVLTPDWRVELTSDTRRGDKGVVQVVTNRHGDLCMQGDSQAGAYFRVSQLIGDGSFRVASGRSERFSDGKTETSSESCGCDAQFATAANPAPAGVQPAIAYLAPASGVREAPAAISSRAVRGQSGADSIEVAQPQVPADSGASRAKRKQRQHSHDVAGYVGSFMHTLFGR